MVHSDMISLLEQCNGRTTWAELAEQSGVEVDGPEILQTRGFINQLDELGFFETPSAAKREKAVFEEWDALDIRPPVCSGSTYPEDPVELSRFLDELLATTSTKPLESEPKALLVPHIDYRVAPTVYGPAFNTLRGSTSELVVMIGTSHYWSDQRIILTSKHFGTPLGTILTNQPLVQKLRSKLESIDLDGAICPTDIAHRPEHSLELHAVFLKHLWANKEFSVLPILVTGFGGEHDEQGAEDLERVAQAIKEVVAESGLSVTWLISGDLAHIGHRFGDEATAREIIPMSEKADEILLQHLSVADADGYHQAIEASKHEFRVCGHAPTFLALKALGPVSGITLAYDVWDDVDTQSAVSFASVAFTYEPLAHIRQIP